jgi:hypothetical protein
VLTAKDQGALRLRTVSLEERYTIEYSSNS